MTERDQSRWLIVSVMFVTLFLIWGPVNAGGVFFLPVVKSFGWSRAQFALLGGLGAIAAGISGPFVGWLIDRAGVRTMMISGAAAVVLCNLALSRANSLAQFAAIFILFGVAITASTVIPCSIVIANWFSSERGLAMGIAFAGIPLGGTGITTLANYVVQHYGWRIGYLTMGLPVAAIVIPTLVVYLRTRPPATTEVAAAIAADTKPPVTVLPGLDLRDALRSRSFWMIAASQLMFNTAWVGVGAHIIPYLIGAGYTSTTAAGILSVAFVLSAAGNFIVGTLADRLNGRSVMALVCISAAAGIVALFAAARGSALAAYLVLFGAVSGTPAVLMPLVIADSLGVKQLGSMLGIEGIFATIGFAAGPIIAGRIYDVTGSYFGALWLFVALSVVSAAAISGCLPLAEEQSRLTTAAVASSA